MSLDCNSSSIKALGNDEGHPEVFKRQLEAFVQKGDVVFALSTSGNSEKVITGDSVRKTEGLLHDRRDREKKGEDGLEVELDTRRCALQGGQRRDVDRSGGDHDVGHLVAKLAEEELFGVEGARLLRASR